MDAALGWRVVGAAALLVGALLAYLLAPSSSVIAGTGLLIDRANAEGCPVRIHPNRTPVVGPSAMRGRGEWWSRPWRSRSGQVAQGAVGSDGVVLDPPVLHQHLGVEQAAERLDGEQLIPEPAAEALDIGVCQGAPGSM
jgi:hypothetical protein